MPDTEKINRILKLVQDAHDLLMPIAERQGRPAQVKGAAADDERIFQNAENLLIEAKKLLVQLSEGN
jgi:hypothetical protein